MVKKILIGLIVVIAGGVVLGGVALKTGLIGDKDDVDVVYLNTVNDVEAMFSELPHDVQSFVRMSPNQRELVVVDKSERVSKATVDTLVTNLVIEDGNRELVSFGSALDLDRIRQQGATNVLLLDVLEDSSSSSESYEYLVNYKVSTPIENDSFQTKNVWVRLKFSGVVLYDIDVVGTNTEF